MSMVLVVLAVVFALVGAAALVLAGRLPSTSSGPALAERQRRLRFRLAIPAFLIGVILFVVGRFV